MPISKLCHFNILQNWKLGFGLAIIYMPARLYLNVWGAPFIFCIHRAPLWVVEFLISGLFFIAWINLMEWLQKNIRSVRGQGNVDEVSFFNQLVVFFIAIALAVLFNQGMLHLWFWMEGFGDHPGPPPSFPDIKMRVQLQDRANNVLLILTMMAAYYLAANARISQSLQQVLINTERLEKENIKTRFNVLKNQVSPHFLFNNFSVLSTLVETDQALSVEFINRLSKAYRYILEQSDHELINLRTEIDFLDTYMFLLKVRFENKIKLEININEEDLNQYSIVPLTLQLLIENAVKHNQMSASNPLVITITKEGEFLVVKNDIKLREVEEHSTKVGLQNIINRYALLVNKEVLISEENNQFIVKIPLIQ